jgi:O-antigen ligase
MGKLGIVVAVALVLAAIGVAWSAWRSLADVEMSTAGMVAMIFGALVTLALGSGLMALIFISNRRGFDDRAGGRPDGKTGKYPD